MPYKVFNIAEVAKYLHLSERDIEQLVKQDQIPFEKQGDLPVFHRKDIDAWASQRILALTGKNLRDYHRNSSAKAHDLSKEHALMPELIKTQWVQPRMKSKTKPAVVREMVALAEKTELLYDPADLLASLEEREKMCSTAIPGGIALLHPRNHEPYMFEDSFIVLGRSLNPIYAGAVDGKSTDIFFLLCCQDDRIHLHALARICTLCHDTTMLESLRKAESPEEMVDVIYKAEQEVITQLRLDSGRK